MELRGLTPKERRDLFQELGFTLTNMPEERFEEAMFSILSKVAPDVEFKDFKEESDAFNEIVKLTYEVSEADAKN
jgi:hypothetical protein